MDHFESIVQTLLEAEGYWVRSSYRVDMTKEEKRSVGKPSMPRPEIDLIALHFARNEVLALEVKSFLDSPGVKLADLSKVHDVAEGRYKLFTSKKHREVVLGRLKKDLLKDGAIDESTTIRLGLAAGKIYRGQTVDIRQHLERNDCFFWSPEEIRSKVSALADGAYENNPTSITAKLLLRGA
jgi:hypothetical protein